MRRNLCGALVLLTLSVGVGSGLSQNATTLALPTGTAKDGAFRFVALGDVGTGGSGQLAVARQLVNFHDQRPYDLAILLGDNIYPNGNPAFLPQKFERPYAELLKRGVRFQAVLGNHDVTLGRTAQINYPLFNMGGRSYYSFARGDDLEVFALDSTQMDGTQVKWLDSELSASKARWKIVVMHHPLYSSARKHGSSRRLQLLLEPLFVRYRVAVVLAGHDHVYERIGLKKGVLYLVSGAGGQLRQGDIDRQNPLLVAGDDRVHSFIYVEGKRDKLMFWAVGEDGQVLDSGMLTSPPAGAGAAINISDLHQMEIGNRNSVFDLYNRSRIR
jgi:predicted phosphodiesterase